MYTRIAGLIDVVLSQNHFYFIVMRIMKKIKHFIKTLLYIFSALVPKDKNLFIFGSCFGHKYWGNAKYFFEYINKWHPEIKALWLTKNKDVIEIIKRKKYKVYDATSFKGTFHMARARICFITHNLYDINEFAAKNVKIFQLRRGTPFIDVTQDTGTREKSRSIHKLEKINSRDYVQNVYSWGNEVGVLSASEEVSLLFARHFVSGKKEIIKMTGYPRNDVLFNNELIDENSLSCKHLIDSFKYAGKKIGLFVPLNGYNTFLNNIELIENQLKELNIILLVKEEKCSLNKEHHSFYSDTIIYLEDTMIEHDFYPILKYTDFLITDMASVFFDYLLLDKPVFFSPFEEKDKNIKFLLDYDQVTPGAKLKNWSELGLMLKEFIENNDHYEKERKSVKNRFNKFHDANNCKRLFECVKNEILPNL